MNHNSLSNSRGVFETNQANGDHTGQLKMKPTQAKHLPTKEAAIAELSKSYLNIIESIGEDSSRDGLLKTPERAAKAMHYFTKGYNETLQGRTSRFYNFYELC